MSSRLATLTALPAQCETNEFFINCQPPRRVALRLPELPGCSCGWVLLLRWLLSEFVPSLASRSRCSWHKNQIKRLCCKLTRGQARQPLHTHTHTYVPRPRPFWVLLEEILPGRTAVVRVVALALATATAAASPCAFCLSSNSIYVRWKMENALFVFATALTAGRVCSLCAEICVMTVKMRKLHWKNTLTCFLYKF